MEDGGYLIIGYGGTVRVSSRPAPAPRLQIRILDGVTGTQYIGEHSVVTSRVDDDDDPYGSGRFGAVPASEAEIARLPAATAGEAREKDCAVCLQSFQEGEELRMMTCPSSHAFHHSCILKWLRVSRLCPLCRFALLPAEQEEDAESDEEMEAEEEETGAGMMVESIAADIEGDTGTLEEANTGSETSTDPAEEEAGACQHTE